MVIIPIVSSLLYLGGGQINKWLRWGMGIPIALLTGNYWVILTYFVATNCFSYGEKMWTTKLFGPWVSMGISGLALGLASIPVLGLYGVIQGIVSMCAFLCIKYFDDKGIIQNPWVELLRGFLGTIVYVGG